MAVTKTPFTPEMEDALLDRENERDAVNGHQDDQHVDDGSDAGNDGQGEARAQEQDQDAPREKPIAMSPQDAKRLAMAERFKRPDAERPFDGDMTRQENLYGDVAVEELQPDPDADDVGVRAADRQPEPAPERKHKIIVRGKELLLTDAELIERASKVEAADSYLEEGRALLEQAKQVRDGRAVPDDQHPDRQTRANEDGQDHDDRQDDTRRPGIDLKSVVEKIQFGDPEEAAKELGKVIADTAQQQANEGHVRRLVTNDLARSQADLKAFREANPDLDADPIASNAIENMIYRHYREEIKALGVDEAQIPKDPKTLADWHRLYRVHGHNVSKTADILQKAKADFDSWRGPSSQPKPAPAKDKPRVQVNVDRTERRMQIPVQPSRNVAPRRDPAPVVEQDSRKSAVQEMRRQRGQPVH